MSSNQNQAEKRNAGLLFNLMELNRFRIAEGLKPIESKVRKCLACKQEFVSDGNRLCGCNTERRKSIVDEEHIYAQ